MEQINSERLNMTLLSVAFVGLMVGLGLYFSGSSDLYKTVWLIGVIPVLLALIIEIVRSLLRGEFGLDIDARAAVARPKNRKPLPQ